MAGQYPGTAKCHRTSGRSKQGACTDRWEKRPIRFSAAWAYDRRRSRNPDSIADNDGGLKQCTVARRGRSPTHPRRAHANELADRRRPGRGKTAQSSAEYLTQPDAEAWYCPTPDLKASRGGWRYRSYARREWILRHGVRRSPIRIVKWGVRASFAGHSIYSYEVPWPRFQSMRPCVPAK